MIGVDEVGRGAWAGPLLVVAVRLNESIEGLTDSKLLSKKRREILCPQIQGSADIGFGWMSSQEIDHIGLSEALKQCCHTAVTALRPKPDEQVVIDGSINLLPEHANTLVVPKAEVKYPCVAAASIVAKVFRDRYMEQLHTKLPSYSFQKHVGYGTALHIDALKTHGVTIWHRMSYKPVRVIADATMNP